MIQKIIASILWIAFLGSSVTAQAQNAAYVGFGLNASTAHVATIQFAPGTDPYWFGRIFVQAGAAVSNGLELRLSLDQGLTDPVTTTLAGDVLYRSSVSPDASVYIGMGPDIVWHWDYRVSDVVLGGEIYAGTHGTFGAEYQAAGFGTFLELRPLILDSFRANFPLVDLRLGVNLHF